MEPRWPQTLTTRAITLTRDSQDSSLGLADLSDSETIRDNPTGCDNTKKQLSVEAASNVPGPSESR